MTLPGPTTVETAALDKKEKGSKPTDKLTVPTVWPNIAETNSRKYDEGKRAYNARQNAGTGYAALPD